MVDSLAGLCDYMVALDGAFRNFPDAKTAWSNADQAEAFAESCASAGIELLLYQPKKIGRWFQKFSGEEVPKRNAAFWLCHIFEPDWVLVIDPDMECIAKAGARELLEWTDKDVAITDVGGFQHRHLFRWSPTLRYLKAHYVTVDGPKTLASPDDTTPLTAKLGPALPALDLYDTLRFDHPEKTDFWRRAQANAYYKIRDHSRVESLFVDVHGEGNG